MACPFLLRAQQLVDPFKRPERGEIVIINRRAADSDRDQRQHQHHIARCGYVLQQLFHRDQRNQPPAGDIGECLIGHISLPFNFDMGKRAYIDFGQDIIHFRQRERQIELRIDQIPLQVVHKLITG
ncbi:hypothetical protein D3C72_1781290 [compost metagenome]